MSAFVAANRAAPDANRAAPDAPPWRDVPRLIAVVRAVLALVWAAGLVIAVGDHVPRTSSDVPIAAAALLASYPAIDVVASLAAALGVDAPARLLVINAAISALAIAAIAATAFGADAGATLAAFGAWAAVSGAIQFGVAVHRCRTAGRQLPMIVSGGLSTIAGIFFLAASGMDDAHLAGLGGYMALGALLYLLFAYRSRTAPASGSISDQHITTTAGAHTQTGQPAPANTTDPRTADRGVAEMHPSL
jgi:hypothetical protein